MSAAHSTADPGRRSTSVCKGSLTATSRTHGADRPKHAHAIPSQQQVPSWPQCHPWPRREPSLALPPLTNGVPAFRLGAPGSSPSMEDAQRSLFAQDPRRLLPSSSPGASCHSTFGNFGGASLSGPRRLPAGLCAASGHRHVQGCPTAIHARVLAQQRPGRHSASVLRRMDRRPDAAGSVTWLLASPHTAQYGRQMPWWS